MAEEKEQQLVLIPFEVRAVDFQGDEIIAAMVEIEDGDGNKRTEAYIPVKPICDFLSVSWPGQYERIMRDSVLSEFVKRIRVTRIPIAGSGDAQTTKSGGEQETICLPLDYLYGWLFGINPDRVRLELRDKIIRYKRDCYRYLAQAFQQESAVTDIEPVTDNVAAVATLEQIREMALSLARLADEHIALEQRVAGHDLRFERAVAAFQSLRDRLTAVEHEVAPPHFINRQQADQIYNQVKALANLMTSKDKAKNHYADIFGVIYRMFGVSGYERIRRGQFESVMFFLDEWRKAVDAGQLAAPRQLEMFGD